jgi:hypothetical protein
MAEQHVLTELIAKRAEIAGKIEHTQDQLRQLVIDLDHIDAAIHNCAHDVTQRQEAADHAGHRTARHGRTRADIANQRLLKLMTKRACLRHWQQRNAATRERGPGQFVLCELADKP